MKTHHPINILLVDDQPANLISLEAILDGMGYHLAKAESGEDALRQLLSREFAMILLDVQMPGMDGFETARMIRARERTRLTPIIFLTAEMNTDAMVAKGYSLGAVDYLIKPLVPEILRAKVAVFVELKQAAEALRQSEERYRRLFEVESDAIIVMERETGAFVDANPAALRLYGYPREEFLRLKQRDVTADPDPTRQTTETGLPSVAMRWHRKKEGTIFPVEVSGAFFESQGRKMHVAAIRDITERKRAEDEIRRQATLISSLLDSIPDIVFFKNTEGVYLGCNPAFVEFVGRPRHEIVGQTDRDLFGPELADSFREKDQQMLATREPRHNEEWITYPGGRKALMDTLKTPYWGPHGELIGVLGIGRDITAQQQAEAALRQSESRQRAITEAAQDAILMMDPKGRISHWNPAAERIFGYTCTEAIGQHLHALIAPRRYHALHEAALSAFRQTGRGAAVGKTIEVEAQRKDGQELSIQLALSAIYIEGGWYAVGVVRDITSAKQAQAAKQEALDRLQKIASRVPGVVYQYRLRPDGSSCFPFASEAIKGIYGVSPEDVREDATTVMQKLHPDDHARVVASIQASAQDLTPWQQEYRVQFDDGAIRTLYGNAVPQREADGSVLWHGFITDITERNLMATRLRQMTERQALAARAGGVGIWDYDVVNNRLAWDDQMCHLYGITRDQFSGTYEAWPAGVHPEDRQRGDEEIQMALRGEKDFDTEFRVLWPDGTSHNIRAIAMVQRDASGQATHMVGTNWDITAQKQAAEQLQQANQSLAAANVRVRAMADQADTANRAKSEFLAMMSHEIRTPMNAVMGMTSLLLNTPLDAQQTEFAHTVAASGEALLDIINDILDFSKIEAGGQFQIEEQPLHLRKLAGGVVQLLQPRAAERGLALTAELAAEIPDWLKGDAGRLRQVLINLAGNGLKFTDRGGVSIRVRPLDTEDSSATPTPHHAQVRLRFEVQDTGIGLSAEDAARLFQPFVQADGGAARRRGGTGLGLAISKRIVELMGGRMGLESAPGQGSMFWFEIALAVTSAPATEAAAADDGADSPHGADPGRRLRILVAEDHEPNRRLAKHMLKSLGYSAEFAVNGHEAVEMWARTDYDLIMMDCQMPGMDGFEATREIRRREAERPAGEGQPIRIVALTANAVKGDRETCLAAGMDGYLSKPYTAQQLGAVLGRCRVRPGHTPPATVGAAAPMAASFNPQQPAQLWADLGAEDTRGIIEGFLEDLPQCVEEVKAVAAAGQLKELARLAHSLQGIGRSVGLDGLSAELRLLEQAAGAGNGGEIEQIIRRLPGGVEESIAAIREWLAARPGAGGAS